MRPGGDVRVDERIIDLLDADRILTLVDGRRYILLELPHDTFMDPLPLLKQLVARGVCPIVSHPERNRPLVARANTVDAWLECGATMQITAGSLTGEFGATAQRAGWYWLETGAAAIVASDAHDVVKRPPRMTRAIDLISKRLGNEIAQRVCVENPLRVVAGTGLELPDAPDELVF